MVIAFLFPRDADSRKGTTWLFCVSLHEKRINKPPNMCCHDHSFSSSILPIWDTCDASNFPMLSLSLAESFYIPSKHVDKRTPSNTYLTSTCSSLLILNSDASSFLLFIESLILCQFYNKGPLSPMKLLFMVLLSLCLSSILYRSFILVILQ